ncbi:MAG TPA: polyprenyl diphosphate synthase [Candidatus Saccharimonadales bacterium]|nr:polyprenyl diphosphate synthase [Candidatus Saccharimonadales bacterium]
MTKQTIFERYPELQTIPKDRFPQHVAIIPDGNGRWAQEEGKFVLHGHQKGAEQIKTILRDLSQIEAVKIVTLWGFSADNWKRSEKEVKGLLFLIQKQIEMTIAELKERNARFIHLGRKDRLPSTLLHIIENAEKETRDNPGQIICIAVDFGGEDQEIRVLEAVRKLSKDTQITKELLWQLRDGQGLIPPADLLIRTAGERRTSDIGWVNGAPTELYFIEKFFPDVETDDIVGAIVDFSKRERRLGARK